MIFRYVSAVDQSETILLVTEERGERGRRKEREGGGEGEMEEEERERLKETERKCQPSEKEMPSWA